VRKEASKRYLTRQRGYLEKMRTFKEGDHYVYTKPGITRPVVIPDWPEVPVFIIKNNLRTANISRDEYFDLLKKI